MERRTVGLLAGPVVAAVSVGVGVAVAAGLPWAAVATAGVTGLCAAWWVLEPIPIPATSLVPFAAFPLLGVLDHKAVAAAYGDTLILLLLGGFLLSAAVERSGAHRRLALGMVRVIGGGPRQVVLGFMLATGLASMWISNTAATLAMLPVALAVIGDDGDASDLGAPLLLGIAYAASIGGLGTPIGTPPNAILMAHYARVTGHEPSFFAWMTIGVPVVAVLLPLAWWLLTRSLPRDGGVVRVVAHLGPWTAGERRVVVVFGLTALAWVTRTEPFGGWSTWAPGAGDATVALLAAALLFVLPDGRGGALLDWPTATRIPWGLLILFGGGLAIALAFEATGLSEAIGRGLAGASWLPAGLLMLVLCLVVTFLTEVTSNTATATLLMPVLAAAAGTTGVDPAVLMVPAALSASCAFMLPVATAPNAIVFGTGRVPAAWMARTGLALNLVGAVAITLVLLAVGTTRLR